MPGFTEGAEMKYGNCSSDADNLLVAVLISSGSLPSFRKQLHEWVVEIHPTDAHSAASRVSKLNASWLIVVDVLEDSELLKTVTSVRAVQPKIRLAVLGGSGDWRRCDAWMRNGCQVYLEEESNFERVAESLHVAATLDVAVTDQAVARLRHVRHLKSGPELTKREREVLELLHRGFTNKEIGATLQISENTVEYHMKHILQKLQARNRLEAVERSTALGLL